MLQDSDTRTVTVKRVATKVRDLQIEGKMRVTLWREATNIPPATGITMLLQDVPADYNCHKCNIHSVNTEANIEVHNLIVSPVRMYTGILWFSHRYDHRSREKLQSPYCMHIFYPCICVDIFEYVYVYMCVYCVYIIYILCIMYSLLGNLKKSSV